MPRIRLDVVGASEAALILGVEVQRISRWREEGRMPPVRVDLPHTTPIWDREDIEILRDNGEWKVSARRSGRAPVPLDVVGLRGASEILGGVDRSQIGRWRRAKQFPAPLLEKRAPGVPWEPGAGIAATPLWARRDIERFAEKRAERAA